MSGDNRYVDDLRILASIELYLNSEFYEKHPSFVKVMNIHSGVFNNVVFNNQNLAGDGRSTQYL